jgi:hypothetical protein
MYTIINILTTVNNISVEILTTILGSITTLFVLAITIYSKYTLAKIKSLIKSIDSTNIKVSSISKDVRDNYLENQSQHCEILQKINSHTAIIEEAIKTKTWNDKLDLVVSSNLEYIDQNPELLAYLEHLSIATKSLCRSIRLSNFKLTQQETKARMANYFLEIAEREIHLNPSIVNKYRPVRKKLERELTDKILQLIKDEILNSKADRFETTILYFIQQTILALVKLVILENK